MKKVICTFGTSIKRPCIEILKHSDDIVLQISFVRSSCSWDVQIGSVHLGPKLERFQDVLGRAHNFDCWITSLLTIYTHFLQPKVSRS